MFLDLQVKTFVPIFFPQCSPVSLMAHPQFDPDKVKVSGPGIEKTGVLASLPVDFIVDTTEAGEAELSIIITVSVIFSIYHFVT